jgi:hypothetical protein
MTLGHLQPRTTPKSKEHGLRASKVRDLRKSVKIEHRHTLPRNTKECAYDHISHKRDENKLLQAMQ